MANKRPLVLYNGKPKEIQTGDTLLGSTLGLEGLLDDRGNHDASGNVWPSTGGSGTSGAILKGDVWLISVAGVLGGVAVNVGDTIRALVDTPGTTASNWAILEGNLGYTPENIANRTTDIASEASPTTTYPRTDAVKKYVGRSPGFSFAGDRPTRDTGAFNAYAGAVTLNKNLDSFSGIFAGSTASNTREKNWNFSFDSQSFFSYGAELDLGAWFFEYEIVRLNNTTVKITGHFSTGSGVSKPFYALKTVDLDAKPDEVVCQIETPGAAGDITLRIARGESVIAPEYSVVSSGLWAYYEADSYSQSDGSNITTNWTDKSGNGRHATVNGSPTFETGELMGFQPAIRLGADSNDYFAVPSMSALTAGTIFVVQKVTNVGTSGAHRFGTGTAPNYPFGADGLIYDDFGSNARKDSLSSYITILNNWHVMHAYSASNNWGLFQNGVRVHTTATNTVSFSSSPLIGTNGASQFMKVDLAGVYLYSNKMTDSRIEQMLAYLCQKWGVVI